MGYDQKRTGDSFAPLDILFTLLAGAMCNPVQYCGDTLIVIPGIVIGNLLLSEIIQQAEERH